MIAIIKHASIDNAVRHLSRHATPQRFTHLCLSGATGRQLAEHVNYSDPGVFVFGLEDWASLPALVKGPSGDPLHAYAGQTRTEQVSAEEFAGRDVIELYISGWVSRFVCDTNRRNGIPYVGLQLDDATFLDAIDPAFVPFRSDTMDWADAPAAFKAADGSPRVDPTAVQETTLVQYTEQAE